MMMTPRHSTPLETSSLARSKDFLCVLCVVVFIWVGQFHFFSFFFLDSSLLNCESYRFRCADAYEPQLLGYVADALNDGNNDTSSADCHGET